MTLHNKSQTWFPDEHITTKSQALVELGRSTDASRRALARPRAPPPPKNSRVMGTSRPTPLLGAQPTAQSDINPVRTVARERYNWVQLCMFVACPLTGSVTWRRPTIQGLLPVRMRGATPLAPRRVARRWRERSRHFRYLKRDDDDFRFIELIVMKKELTYFFLLRCSNEKKKQ